MPSFADFRSRFPSLQDASDEEIIKRTSEVFKLPITEVAQSFDYNISGGKTSQRFGASIDRYQAGLYGTAEAVTKAVGLEGTSDYLQKQRVRNEAQADISSARARELGAIESYKDVTGVGTGVDYVTGLAIGSAPYMAEALVTGGGGRLAMTGTRAALTEGRTALAAAEAAKDVAAADKARQAIAVAERNLNIGSTASGFAGQYPSGVGEMLSQQREQTGGQTDLTSALGYGAGYTALGMVGVEGALTRGNLFRNTINFLDKPGGLSGAALRTGATAVSTGLKEGVSETLQEGTGQGARMAVDDKAQFFDQDAVERYKESFVGGAALGGVMGGGLGGWRRSNSILPGATTDPTQPQVPANNDIQQAFGQPQTSGTPTTNLVPPPPAPPITPSADTTPPPAPIVSGGTTPIAQATQQQSQADAAAQQQQQQQAQRDLTISQFGLAGDTPGTGSFFGRPIFGPAINQVADALAPIAAQLNPAEAAIMDAIVTADQKLGNKLLSFQFNADKIANSVQKGVQAVTTAATKFQIADVQTVGEAAYRLNELSKSAKGQALEQINAIHEALTGKDTEGYIASQTSKSKGKPNAQQQSQQVSSGLGTVPVQGGTIQGDGGLTGLLQPGAVQPVGAGVVSGAANDQQTGQLPGEGIRTGPSVTAADDLGNAAQASQVTAPAPDTNQLLRQVFGGNYAIDESIPPATISGPVRVPGSGGAVRVQPQQTTSTGVPGSVPESVGGERVVRRKRRVVTSAAATPSGMQFYSTAIEHIHPTKRSEIVLALLVQALETQGKVGGGDNQLSAVTRAQIVQLSLMEQMTAQEIAIALATSDTPVDVKPDTIQKQRTRLGIKENESGGLVVDTNSDVGKKFLSAFVEAAANFKTDAFPDGIGPDQLRGFYAAKNTFNDNGAVVELGDLVEEAASRTTDVKLQEELYRTNAEGGDTQAMGVVSPGGSQGNVDSTKKAQLNKKTKARVLDVEALDQITNLEAEADKLRDALEEMAPKDPRREGLVSRLEAIGDIDNGEIADLWSQYNQAQQIRSKEAEAAGVEKKEEKVAAPEELTGAAPSEREDADLDKAAKAEQGTTDAVQEPSTEKVSVPEGAKVGKATRVRKAKVEEKDRPEIVEQRSTLERLLPKTIGKFTLESITPYSGNWTVKYGSTNASGMKSSQNAPIDADMLTGKSDEEIQKLLTERLAKNGLKDQTKEVLTPKEQWDALTQQFPGMPPYDVLTKSEKETWDDFANRGFGDIGSVATVLGGADKIAKASEAVTETAAPAVEKQPIVSERGAFIPSAQKGGDPIASAGFKTLDEDNDLSNDLAGATFITGMNVSDRNKGTGTKLLNAIVNWADKNDKIVVLVPAATPDSALGGLSQEQLKAWYARNGFEDRVDYMVREPASKAAAPVEETVQEQVAEEPTVQEDVATLGKLKSARDKAEKEFKKAENLSSGDPRIKAAKDKLEVAQEKYTKFLSEAGARSDKRMDAREAALVEETVQEQVTEEVIAPQLEALPEAQVQRLETHYGEKRDSASFLAKVKEDVVLYATKGAQAVAGAIRDVIKAIHAGVLSVAMVFNPGAISQLESFVVIPQETQTTTQQVLAEVPADVVGMSDAGKQAYATLIPALKGKLGDKFITIADKPSGRIFVFKADGSLVLQKKALFGLAKGDLYKGNNDVPSNRVTPAGLFGINIVDAAKGGAAAKTAGDYDFGKVFALDDPDATVTFMHSVWLKESDAPKRAAALKNESATDSRYSFGCINVDKETFKDMVTKYSDQMDGSKLFVVPDAQSTVNDFVTGNVADDRLIREGVQPVTRTTTTPVKSATQTAGVDQTIVGKEEQAPTTQQSRTNQPVVERYTAEELQTSLLDYVNRESLGKDVFVIDELEDLRSLPEFAAMTDEEFAKFLAKEKIDGQTQAFVTENGKAYLLASNIDVGTGRGVFMHEVGVHLGLQEKLPDASFVRLVDQIKVWAKLDDGSIENQLAIAASDRVFQSRVSDPVQRRREFVAYFVEAAVNAGLNPKAYENIQSAGLREWMRSLWAALKNALRKLRGINIDKLSAQDVVDMTYGYAQMAIGAPKFQGSGKIFRKFQMKFAGTGVGQMYGHGLYFTDRPEVASGFAKGQTPQLYGADLAIANDELLDWNTPVAQQSAIAQKAAADAAKEFGVISANGSALYKRSLRGGDFYNDLANQMYKKATGKDVTTKAQVTESQKMASELNMSCHQP